MFAEWSYLECEWSEGNGGGEWNNWWNEEKGSGVAWCGIKVMKKRMECL